MNIEVIGLNHWLGRSQVPEVLLNLTKTGDTYLLTPELFQDLLAKYDVQLFHGTKGLILMLDNAGRRHQQR